MLIFAQASNLCCMGLPAATMLRLRTQLDCLPILLEGIGEGALEKKPGPGKWSARENLAHLARYHEMFLTRLKRILHEERPSLERYSAEEDPDWPRWIALPAGEVLARLERLRSEMIALVERLSDAESARVGVHSRFREMTLVEWLEFFLLHEAHHLFVVMQRVRE